jgi:hypothetical protein
MIDEKKLTDEIKNWIKTDRFEDFSAGYILSDVIEEIDKMPKVGEWIPVSERLPEEHDSVFAKFKGTSYWTSGLFEKISNTVMATVELEDGTRKVVLTQTLDGEWNLENRIIKKKVTAWMPLPEAYGGEESAE